MDFQWQADLVEMQPFARENRGYRYLLTVIDILSRYAWAVPVMRKSAISMLSSFKTLFKQAKSRKPRLLQTDQGLEFENRPVLNYLQSLGIEQFSVKSEYKAAIVERFNRTLKERMWRAFTKQGTHKWLTLLPRLLHAYNHSFHRTIGRQPAEVTPENEADVWLSVHGRQPAGRRKKPKFALGNRVRISRHKATFDKGYEPNWSEEEYTIHSVNTKFSPTTYQIRSLDDKEVIEGSFYDQELQLVTDREGYARIDAVLRTRGTGVRKEALVRWRGYKQPTWIKYSKIEGVEDVPF